jgi:hypothetical protein
MSAESRALECEAMRPSSLDRRDDDIVVDGIASDLAYHVLRFAIKRATLK